jgi:hypothetical protein
MYAVLPNIVGWIITVVIAWIGAGIAIGISALVLGGLGFGFGAISRQGTGVAGVVIGIVASIVVGIAVFVLILVYAGSASTW